MKTGAYTTGIYPNYFAEIGIGEKEAGERLRRLLKRSSLIRNKISAIILMKMPGAWWTRETMTHEPKE